MTKKNKKAPNQVEYLKEKAQTLLDVATMYKIQDQYLFTTTYNRYLLQLNLLKKMQDEFNNVDILTSKEYVKGRENVQIHPLVKQINSTIDSMNKTTSIMLKVLEQAKKMADDQREYNDYDDTDKYFDEFKL